MHVKPQQIALALMLAATAGPAFCADANQARNLAATCTSCHGTDGRSQGGIESLAGIEKEKLLQKLKDFRAGTKPATVMQQITKGYSDEQLELMAGYFASPK
ncbi:MAG: c-type cytochrome [Zoogloea sp.]|nr:c-type cytochrome [Zoogloea sp.]